MLSCNNAIDKKNKLSTSSSESENMVLFFQLEGEEVSSPRLNIYSAILMSW